MKRAIRYIPKDAWVFVFVVAAFVVAAWLDTRHGPDPCSTDTECMERHGGSGGPEAGNTATVRM